MIDASKFSVNEQAGQYYVTIEVRGIMRLDLKADSPEEAREKAEAEADRLAECEMDIELDGVDDLKVSSVRPKPKMYRVFEGEKKMQVSHLTEAHTPREPDERGF